MIKIGIDVMGGDFAPNATVKGILEALPHLAADEIIVLIGVEEKIKTFFNAY